MTDEHRPPYLDELSPDAVLVASTLRKPIRGSTAIAKVVAVVGSLYASQTQRGQRDLGGRELIEYDAVLLDGQEVTGSLVLTRSTTGAITHLAVTHSPLGGVLVIAEALHERLAGELGADLFL